MRVPDADTVDQALLEWFEEARRKSEPISSRILTEKALEFASRLGVANFTAGVGWLGRFKARHGIQLKAKYGQSATVSCESETMEDWKNSTLQALLEEFSPSDIFNADETGLFYKCLPTRTLAENGESTSGVHTPKDRLTLLLAANMTGTEKLPLLTIGKSVNPRCLRNVRTRPTLCQWNRKAWMTSTIFEGWVKQLDRKFQLLGRSIALIIDNCPAHQVIPDLRAITLVFLPPNTTRDLQPCDQGIIQSLKVHYRRRVLRQVIARVDAGEDPKSCLDLSIFDAMIIASAAWNDVTQDTIANCFRHAGFSTTTQSGNEEEPSSLDSDRIEVEELLEQLKRRRIQGVPSAEDLFETDNSDLPTSAPLIEQEVLEADNTGPPVSTPFTEEEVLGTDNSDLPLSTPLTEEEDIVSSIQQKEEDTPLSESEEEDESLTMANVTSRQCLEALSTVQAYLLQHAGSIDHLQPLVDIKSFVEDTAISKRRQKTIKDYFKSK
ncbi:tigger transposable element-derived protein 6 [Aplysia californica]|uniref:Tigger transposable element-derived protein 6 n=1 Tax=Aplysia californica TaxID=6500 RepID=A0ABM0JB85_APLCA|nr:tigger transposable element-derived protein 6 [Aplysia californica]